MSLPLEPLGFLTLPEARKASSSDRATAKSVRTGETDQNDNMQYVRDKRKL